MPDDAWRALPDGAVRSIESIAVHVGACKVMYDDYAFGSGTLEFGTPAVEPWAEGAAPRDEVVAWLEAAHLRFVEHVADWPTTPSWTRRDGPTGARTARRAGSIGALITHDAYHAGEINHIRSLLDGDDRWRFVQLGFG